MNFYYALTQEPEASRWSFLDIINAYRTACGGSRCDLERVNWNAVEISSTLTTASLREGAAEYAGELSEKGQAFSQRGDDFGVSDKP